jgi:two-component system chemotaxis response regulator CheY
MHTDLALKEPARERRGRILIVEHNAIMRDLLRGIMRHDADLIVVGEASSGENAIDLAEKLCPDLVCLDVLLPGLDGIAILRALRAVHPEMRVVIVTAQATNSIVSEALALGASGFVVKPFNAARLLSTVRSALAAPAPKPARDSGQVAGAPPGLSLTRSNAERRASK